MFIDGDSFADQRQELDVVVTHHLLSTAEDTRNQAVWNNISKWVQEVSTPLTPFLQEVTTVVIIPMPLRMRNIQKTVGIETSIQRINGTSHSCRLISITQIFLPILFWFVFKFPWPALFGEVDLMLAFPSPHLAASWINSLFGYHLRDWLCCTSGKGLGLGYRAKQLTCVRLEGDLTMTEESQLSAMVWFHCYIHDSPALATLSLFLFLNLSELVWGWENGGMEFEWGPNVLVALCIHVSWWTLFYGSWWMQETQRPGGAYNASHFFHYRCKFLPIPKHRLNILRFSRVIMSFKNLISMP